jgi:hypothetical protein
MSEHPTSEERTQPNTHVIQSHVWHGDHCYFVSTIDRESSAALAYGARYWETLVWRWEGGERTDLLHQAEGRRAHFNICQQLIEHGEGALNSHE